MLIRSKAFSGGCKDSTCDWVEDKSSNHPSFLGGPAALRSVPLSRTAVHKHLQMTRRRYMCAMWRYCHTTVTRCTKCAAGFSQEEHVCRAIICLHPREVIDVVMSYSAQAAHEKPAHISRDRTHPLVRQQDGWMTRAAAFCGFFILKSTRGAEWFPVGGGGKKNSPTVRVCWAKRLLNMFFSVLMNCS